MGRKESSGSRSSREKGYFLFNSLTQSPGFLPSGHCWCELNKPPLRQGWLPTRVLMAEAPAVITRFWAQFPPPLLPTISALHQPAQPCWPCTHTLPYLLKSSRESVPNHQRPTPSLILWIFPISSSTLLLPWPPVSLIPPPPPVPNHFHPSFQKANFSEELYRLTITTSLTSGTPASLFQLPGSSSHLCLLPKIGHQRPHHTMGLLSAVFLFPKPSTAFIVNNSLPEALFQMTSTIPPTANVSPTHSSFSGSFVSAQSLYRLWISQSALLSST